MTSKLFPRQLPRRLCLPALLLLAACGGGNGGGQGSAGTPPTTPPPAPVPTPTPLTALAGSDRSVTLAWPPMAGASGYTVQRRAAGAADYQTVAELPATRTQFVDDGLQADTAYDYRVQGQGTAAGVASASARTGGSDDAPLASAPAVAGELLAEAQVGADGARLQSTDGRVLLDLPAGSFAGPTAVRLRRLANPLAVAPQEDGVLVEMDATPQQPPVLTVGWDEPLDADADGLRLAVQRADGSWLALPRQQADLVQRRLVTALPAIAALSTGAATPATAARPRALAGGSGGVSFRLVKVQHLYLLPQRTGVPVGRTLEFKPWAHVKPVPPEACPAGGDELCLPVPVVKARELPLLNQHPDYERVWSVQDVVGGNATVGTVQPLARHGAVYTAPDNKPAVNPVTLSFRSTHRASGRGVTLKASVRITQPQWGGATRGHLSAAQGGDLAFWFGVTDAVWRPVAGGSATEERYEVSGIQRIEVENITCTGSAAPATATLPKGTLVIDRSASPPRYTLDIGSTWATVITGTCPGNGSASVPMQVPGRLQASGEVSADGRRIEGSSGSGDLRWEWFFSLGE